MMETSSEIFKILFREHENILKVIGALSYEMREFDQKEIDFDFFNSVLGFIKGYADKFHHAKEEDILFKEFNRRAEEGTVHCNPVGQMLFEHNLGREGVGKMESGLKEKDKNKLKAGAREYIDLIKEHIFKEDNILYPMADEAFSDQVKEEMLQKFLKIEKTEQKKVNSCLKFVNSLSEKR